MDKQTLNKTKNVFLIFITIGVFISGFMLYQEKVQNQRGYELFLNRFYNELTPAINDIEVLLYEKDMDEERFNDRIVILETRLAKLDSILDLGSATLSYNIQDQPSFTQYADLENLYENEDNQKVLRGLKEVLFLVQKEMYSEETKQEDPNLTVDEFNQIIQKGTSLYEEKILN